MKWGGHRPNAYFHVPRGMTRQAGVHASIPAGVALNGIERRSSDRARPRSCSLRSAKGSPFVLVYVHPLDKGLDLTAYDETSNTAMV